MKNKPTYACECVCLRLLIDVKPLVCLPVCLLARSLNACIISKRKLFFSLEILFPLLLLLPLLLPVAVLGASQYIVAGNGFVFFCLCLKRSYIFFHNADVRYTITCECVGLSLALSLCARTFELVCVFVKIEPHVIISAM